MVEIPVVVHVLVVPDDLACVAVERERRVVVQVRLVRSAEHELGRRRRDRGAGEDQVELRVVARRHPGADVGPLLERHVAPGLVAWLARCGNRAAPPQLLAGQSVVGRDHARVGPGSRRAAAARERLAVADDRAGALERGMDLVVEDHRLPDHLPGLGVEREEVVVDAGVDDQVRVNRDVPVVLGQEAADVVLRVLGDLAPVLPDQIACRGVEGLDHVVRIRHVHDASVGEGRARLAAVVQRAGPHHPEIADVLRRDLVERAVAPAVRGATPHEPVPGRRVLEHLVGDRDEHVAGLGVDGGEAQ